MIDVRMFVPSDLDAFRAFVGGLVNEWLDQSSVQRDATCCPERTVDAVLEQFDRSTQTPDSLVVAVDDQGEQVVGSLVLEYGPRWLRSAEGSLLNVHPDYRTTGCARRLLGFASSALRKKWIKRLRLVTWDGNDPAMRLFLSCGAHIVARTNGKTVTTANFLPLVLNTINDSEAESDVRGGAFRGHATIEGDLLNFQLRVRDTARQLCILPS